MIRFFSTAAVIALTLSAAHAEPADQMSARIHDAAVAACAPEHAAGTQPSAYYGAIDSHCVYRISRSAEARYQAIAAAKAAERSKLAQK